MRTELSRIATIQTGLTGGARALVALFEYAKPDETALTAAEIDDVLTAAVDAAAERGATVVWRATPAQVAPVAPADGEELALETALTVVKIAPDAAPDETPEELEPEPTPEASKCTQTQE